MEYCIEYVKNFVKFCLFHICNNYFYNFIKIYQIKTYSIVICKFIILFIINVSTFIVNHSPKFRTNLFNYLILLIFKVEYDFLKILLVCFNFDTNYLRFLSTISQHR